MINDDLDFEKSYSKFLQDPTRHYSSHFKAWDGYSIVYPKIEDKIWLEGS